MSNLKLDIIYYKTSSDFELEFNLNGCCRMRIFKDKVENHKDLIKALARDVSRSRLILIVTDLFGEQNGVELVSIAIGASLCQLNKSEYGIKNAESIAIPVSSVPLVNKDGVFGGCILESGPQSIIFVSSDRTLRHEIMKAYVHNYIFDISQIIAYNERMGNATDTTLPPIEYMHPVSAPAEESEENAQETSKEESIPETEEAEEEIPSVTEEKEPERFTVEIDDDIDLNDDAYTLTIQSGTKSKPRKKGLNIALLVLTILLLICFGVLAYFFVYLPLIGEDASFFIEDNFITELLKEWFSN